MTLSEVAGRYFFLYIFRKELSASVTSSDNGGIKSKNMHPALLQLLSLGLLAELVGNPEQKLQTTINDPETGDTLLLTDEETKTLLGVIAKARPRHHRMRLLLEYANGVELSGMNVDSLDLVSRRINARLGLHEIPEHMIQAAHDLLVEIEDMRRPAALPQIQHRRPAAKLKAKVKKKPSPKKK